MIGCQFSKNEGKFNGANHNRRAGIDLGLPRVEQGSIRGRGGINGTHAFVIGGKSRVVGYLTGIYQCRGSMIRLERGAQAIARRHNFRYRSILNTLKITSSNCRF